ncbi:TetR family transcriptional regulator [Kribbella sandramycini]|uniref:AcrR family transcriptional regulator n=1 Tax=Kribbella sandramycini TaxID=60450 RepID=A0A7Y4L4X8_9ACTN|nr:TetR family transcriptional regulator [Kribbella sandramycini]MBB6571779.1 AcrR family transcriptional regulator [Kribbella sandramycini]NOL44422.1 TetR family transcriptional regulator [Kribbella sandramycini]
MPERSEAAEGAAERPAAGARKRDREATRARLLECARLRFARDGYDGTSVRDVAGDVGVDPALVFRYFGSKSGLFTEAMTTSHEAVPLPDGPLEDLPAKLMHQLVFQDWSEYAGEHPLIAMLRSASHEDTRDRLRQQVCDGYLGALAELAQGNDKALRAELFGAFLLGVGILRTAVGTPHLTVATESDLTPHLTAIAQALFGPTPPPAPSA